MTFATPWNVLLSPHHGLFVFHPATALAAIALTVLAFREIRVRRPAWATIATLWLLAVATLHGLWSEWANEGGYGQRFAIDALPVLAIGFAAFLEAGRARGARVGAAIATTLFGFLLFFAALGGLVAPPAGLPWPQRLEDYAPLLRDPPGPGEWSNGLQRSSFALRAIWPQD